MTATFLPWKGDLLRPQRKTDEGPSVEVNENFGRGLRQTCKVHPTHDHVVGSLCSEPPFEGTSVEVQCAVQAMREAEELSIPDLPALKRAWIAGRKRALLARLH